MRSNWWTMVLFTMGTLLLSVLAQAAPPADADPALSPWFQSLRQPENGVGCCSEADCRPAAFRTSPGGYEVWIDDRWQQVPPEKVLQRTDNPVGQAIVCWTKKLGILCFVRAPQA